MYQHKGGALHHINGHGNENYKEKENPHNCNPVALLLTLVLVISVYDLAMLS